MTIKDGYFYLNDISYSIVNIEGWEFVLVSDKLSCLFDILRNYSGVGSGCQPYSSPDLQRKLLEQVIEEGCKAVEKIHETKNNEIQNKL